MADQIQWTAEPQTQRSALCDMIESINVYAAGRQKSASVRATREGCLNVSTKSQSPRQSRACFHLDSVVEKLGDLDISSISQV